MTTPVYRAYLDGNTIDLITSAGEDFVYGDLLPSLSGVFGRTALYEALASNGNGFVDDSIGIYLNSDQFVSHDRFGEVVLGWVDGMRGANVSIFSGISDASDYMEELRAAAREEGILAEDTD